MKQPAIKNLLYLFICLFSLNLSAQEDDGADFTCTNIGPFFTLQAWDPVCNPNGFDAMDGDLVQANVTQTFITTSCNTTACGGLPISFHIEYYNAWSLEYSPDGWPEENGANMPGSHQGLGSTPLINEPNLENYFTADENGTYDQGFFIPLWQTGFAEFNDNGFGDGLACTGFSGDFDGVAWFEIYGPDGVGIGIAADPVTYTGGGGCGAIGAPGNAPLTVDLGTIYQGGMISMTSTLDGLLADIASTGPVNQNLGSTVGNSYDYPNGVSSFEFTIDPSQMSTGLHTLTFELSGFDAADCNNEINTIVIEILDCDTVEGEDENDDVDTPNEAVFDFIEVEGCADSGADDNVIWIKGGGAATINPGPLCLADPINLPGGISVPGTTWDFGLFTNPNDNIGTGVGNAAPATCAPGAAPAAVPCIAESFADIDPGLILLSSDNLCDAPVVIYLPQNNTCQTIVWSVFAYQFLFGLDLDCDDLGEYNPDFIPIRFDIYVLPNDPITEIITQANVCSQQAEPVIVRYGHDLNGDGHLENCGVDVTGIQGVPDGIVDALDNEICFEEIKAIALQNQTCGQLPDSFDYEWTAVEQEAAFCAPTNACYTDISGAENFMVNAEQPTFEIVGLTAEICSGATAQYTVEVRATDGSLCGSKVITQVGDNMICNSLDIDLDWEYTDAEVRGLLGHVDPTALTGACPEVDNDPQNPCIVGDSGTESVTVYSAQLTAVVNTNVMDACSEATDVVIIDLESADGTVCDTKMYDASPNEGCALNAESFDYEWTVAEIETITGAPSALACYAPVMGTEMVNVYPAQYTASITNIGDACTEATDVLIVDLLSVDGTVCDTEMFDAPPNNTCVVSNEMFNYEWTTTELEALTGTPSALACYTPVMGMESVNVFPDATTWIVTETPGDCGLAATVSIDAGASNCFNETGNVPPAGVCPDTDGTAPLTYSFDPMFPAACNMMFGNTIDATCAPVDCCPDIDPDIATQLLCTGEEPDFTIIESEVNVSGTNIGGFSYFMDAVFTVPYAATEITNLTCDPIDITIYGRLQCSDPGAADTADEFDDFTFVITVFPNANNFVVAEVEGVCNTAASVSITAENGDECFAGAGNAPVDPGCDQPDDVQDYTYSFDPGFIANCNLIFGSTIPASCATTSFSGDPDFECPPADINYCDGGILDLLQVDLNGIAGATGTFSGTALPYIIGSQNPGGGATIDVSTLPIGILLTLEYTVTAPGCDPVTTTSGCSFIATVDCDADGGRF